jgi:hypothetical protein
MVEEATEEGLFMDKGEPVTKFIARVKDEDDAEYGGRGFGRHRGQARDGQRIFESVFRDL